MVTGHQGYIGAVLVPMLLARGHSVKGMDIDLYKRCSFAGKPTVVSEFCKDIRDAEIKDFLGVDAIIHLAGLSNDPLGDLDPVLTREINTLATVRLAEIARQSGVQRFLFASSCSNYGIAGENFVDESSVFNPVTAYGVSKVEAEQALGELATDKFSPVFLRAGTAYGYSPRLRFDLVVNNLTAWATFNKKVLLKSLGTSWRPLVHVEDICLGYLSALEAPIALVHNEAFNLGSTSENYRVTEIALLVKNTVPDCIVEFENGALADSRTYRVDCNKISLTLEGYKPQWTVARGIQQLYQVFDNAGLSKNDFEGAKYQRIAHIHWLIERGIIDSNLRLNKPSQGYSCGV